MCVSLDDPNESSKSMTEDLLIRQQLQAYDAEVNRGIVHTHTYDIKMQQYRLSIEGRPPR